MSSAWAVVVGAAIAFLATLAGSLLTPLVQTSVERRRAREDRDEEEDRRRYAALGPILKEWVDASQDVTLAIVAQQGSPGDASLRLSTAAHAILLELRREDEPLIPAIAAAAARFTGTVRSGDGLRLRAELSSSSFFALAAWRRGTLTPTHAADALMNACHVYDQASHEGSSRTRVDPA